MAEVGSLIQSLLRRWEGPLTSDLCQRPGDFGLGNVPERLLPDAVTTSVCGFCSTGCGLKVHLREGEALNLSASPEYPVNLGMACPKGWEALAPLDAPDRATVPMLRDAEGVRQPVGWAQAASAFCENFKRIQAVHGPESVAFLSTGQIVSEEMAFLGALAKFGMGMIHGDGNTRQCMATAVSAYKESFGFDAPPYTYADFEESDAIVLVGSNLCIAHPIMWQRVMQNRRSPEIVVVDPRRTETAVASTQHLAIRPKSDLVLLYGTAAALLERDAVVQAFIEKRTEGFMAFEKFVGAFRRERVLAETGLSADVFDRFVETIATRERVSFWWTMGVNQGHEATRTAQAIINLALMTGNIGRPGTGANSITGQCNAMGSRLFSGTASLFCGREFGSADDRWEVAEALGIEEWRIPRQQSLAYDQIIDRIESGKIRGLWVVATNTAHSWTRSRRARDLLDKLDYLVVQDMYHSTETAAHADLLLPAAGWGEKEGTFVNSERRIGRVRKVRRAPGQALADFRIFRLLAEAWGCGETFRGWDSPEQVFDRMKELARGRPCDISGIAGYGDLDEAGGIQWPCRADDDPAGNPERRLFEDGVFFRGNGKALFVFEEPKEMPEKPDAEYPFLLLTGRATSAQWHTQTRTGKSAVLQKLYPASVYLEMNAADARELGVAEGDRVRVSSRRGEIVADARISPTVAKGQVFLPMHYAETNLLTIGVVDPYSRQPSYKANAVAVRKV